MLLTLEGLLEEYTNNLIENIKITHNPNFDGRPASGGWNDSMILDRDSVTPCLSTLLNELGYE